MTKYFKTFEELKVHLVIGEEHKDFYDLVVNDIDKAMEYARSSRFSRNPLSNIMDYQQREHYLNFDDFLDLLVCMREGKNRKNGE